MKKTTLLIAAIAVLLISFKTTGPTTWTLDSVHSNLGFSILHFMVSDVKGTVLISEASIKTLNEDFTDASISLKADLNTIDTDNDKRDAHLKEVDFFNTEKFPELTFVSTTFKKADAGKYTINGNLTLHGLTKPVILYAIVKSGINPMNNKPITGFKVTGTIKRSDFDISVSTPVEIISDEVAIEANMVFVKE